MKALGQMGWNALVPDGSGLHSTSVCAAVMTRSKGDGAGAASIGDADREGDGLSIDGRDGAVDRDDEIGRLAVDHPVVARRRVAAVATALADQPIVTGASAQRVVAAASEDAVLPVTTLDDVVARTGTDDVVSVAGEDPVRAALGEDDVPIDRCRG